LERIKVEGRKILQRCEGSNSGSNRGLDEEGMAATFGVPAADLGHRGSGGRFRAQRVALIPCRIFGEENLTFSFMTTEYIHERGVY